MQTTNKSSIFLLWATIVWCGFALGADYDLDSPTIELQRIQHCDKCHSPLIVTTIPPGAAIRCPKTGHVMKRLPDSELEVKIYQVCPSCGTRMDVSGLKSFQPFKCGNCGLVQRVLPEAVYLPPTGAGKGIVEPITTLDPVKATLGAGSKRQLTEPVVPGLNAPEFADPQNAANVSSSNSGSVGDNSSVGGTTALTLTPTEYSLNALPTASDTVRPAVYVNGEPISESAVARALQKNFEMLRLNRYISGSGKPTMQQLNDIRKDVIDSLVDRCLIVQAAEKSGYKPQPDTVTTLASTSGITPEQARNEVIIEAMRRRYSSSGTAFDDNYLKRYYNDNLAEFSDPDRYLLRALIIYVDRDKRVDQREAEVIASEVSHKIKFGVDFMALAARYSEGPFRSEGGEVRTSSVDGLLPVTNLARPVRRKIEPFASGKIVGPVALPGCIAFFKMENFIRGKAKDFSKVYDAVKYQAMISARDKAFDDWVASLKRAALVEFPKKEKMVEPNSAGMDDK